ncbi:MAG: pyridoxamine 5'-phosphate oxidase family protein [Candidatus Aenigmarchaeota archaeon]|nr:pyridoxamine 5'-phosphate oxidase family protein [Candidatus Aenigmarchaeota archaeon]
MNWKDNFEEGKEIVLATCSKENIPNANVVISLGFVDNKLLVADCQMNNTIKNLKENQNICVIGVYFRIKGTVQIFSSGKYFDMCVEKNKDYKVKNAILVKIDEVFDLDKVKKIL